MINKEDLAQSTLVVTDSSAWPSLIAELTSGVHQADQWIQADLEKPATSADVRTARHAASQMALGKGKLLIFLWADRFNPPVANALLKLLEEPPLGVRVLLLSETERVLPTIRSRTRLISLRSETSTKNDWKLLLEHFNPEIKAERVRLTELLYLTPLVHATVQTSTLTEGYSSL